MVYTSVDQPVAEPILREFEKQSGIRVDIRTDAEASKSVGLAERLRAERGNPACDVWWGNEVFHTIRLADEGVLAGYASPAGKDISDQFKDTDGKWYSTGLRARVIAQHGALGAEHASVRALTDPALRGRVAMARPTAGTTGGHVAALYAAWGADAADAFFRGLRANEVRLVGGNSVVAEQVGQGTFVLGLTDNDDVDAALAAGGEVRAVVPDQDGLGTLTMPTTVALVAGAPRPDEARKLIDAKFAGWSVRGGATGIKSMSVDYREVARVMPAAVRRATDILDGRTP